METITKQCKECGRVYIIPSNDAEHVWLIEDGELICARCWTKKHPPIKDSEEE